jgi:hypothetical protein
MDAPPLKMPPFPRFSIFSQLCGRRIPCFHLFVLSLSIVGSVPITAVADEHLFGWVLGAKTLPKHQTEAYEFLTLRTGKTEGTYLGWDDL